MSDLQFDRAEGAGGPAAELKCTACGQAIRDSYFEVNGNVVCARCRHQVEQQLAAGTSAGRFGKALALGLAAAAAGTALYYAVLALTGYELSLIAIVVGYIVGTAVKKGSNGRGGWRYQALAMFLTYTSIVSSYVPLMIKEFGKANQAMVADSSGAAKGSAKDTANVAAIEPAIDSADAEDAALPEMSPFVAIVLLVGLVYALPFLAGIQNILGLVIIAIGLYTAWTTNKRQQLAIAGPFKVGEAR